MRHVVSQLEDLLSPEYDRRDRGRSKGSVKRSERKPTCTNWHGISRDHLPAIGRGFHCLDPIFAVTRVLDVMHFVLSYVRRELLCCGIDLSERSGIQMER